MRPLERIMNWLITLVWLSVFVLVGSGSWYIYSGKWWWTDSRVAPYRQRAEEIGRQAKEATEEVKPFSILSNLPRRRSEPTIPESWVVATQHRCAVYISIANRALVLTKNGKLLTTQSIMVSVGSGAQPGVYVISKVDRGSSPNEVTYWLQLSPAGGGDSGQTPSGIYDQVGKAAAREGSYAIPLEQFTFMEQQGCFEIDTPVLVQEVPSQWTNSQNFNFGGSQSK